MPDIIDTIIPKMDDLDAIMMRTPSTPPRGKAAERITLIDEELNEILGLDTRSPERIQEQADQIARYESAAIKGYRQQYVYPDLLKSEIADIQMDIMDCAQTVKWHLHSLDSLILVMIDRYMDLRGYQQISKKEQIQIQAISHDFFFDRETSRKRIAQFQAIKRAEGNKVSARIRSKVSLKKAEDAAMMSKQGFFNPQIAAALGVDIRTVRRYLNEIQSKK